MQRPALTRPGRATPKYGIIRKPIRSKEQKMRDLRAGGDINVGGDVIINDHAEEVYKPLSQCSNEELKMEREHRRLLLEEEQGRRTKLAIGAALIAVAVGIALAIWHYFSEKVELAMFGIGFAGIFMPVAAAFKIAEQQSDFEIRQIQALDEIQNLLRERRVE